jgi:hypothetical protein
MRATTVVFVSYLVMIAVVLVAIFAIGSAGR